MLKKEIIKEFVASLKEDGELDYIFPILLERMGYRILSTPVQSKGQSQYGRDVVAVKKIKRQPTLCLFELKGFRTHDINDRNLNEKDGFIESMRASKYTDYKDASIPGLEHYPRRYFFVHNGTVEERTKPTLDGFVKKEFPDGNFERWDLYKLTDLFSKYLFEETLLTDEESYRLLKKILVLLDSEGNDFSDLVKLINRQVSKVEVFRESSDRSKKSFFATLRLIGALVHYYAIQANNLYPSKYCMDTIVLKTWGWVLRNKLEKNQMIISLFRPLVTQQLVVYEAYLNKIIDAAGFNEGLYSFRSTDTEYIFYPLRCYDFLGDLMYYSFAIEPFGVSKETIDDHKDVIRSFITNNGGFKMPLLDTHSIPIQLVSLYMHGKEKENANCMAAFVTETVVNLVKRYQDKKMWPELKGNRMALARSLYNKSDDYCCESSLLIVVLFELLSYLGLEPVYSKFREVVNKSKVNLQVSYPIADEYNIEECLFDHRLYEELSVQTDIKIPKTLKEFRQTFRKPYESIQYRTDAAGFSYLRILAHVYYQTDLFPDFLGRAYCESI